MRDGASLINQPNNVTEINCERSRILQVKARDWEDCSFHTQGTEKDPVTLSPPLAIEGDHFNKDRRARSKQKIVILRALHTDNHARAPHYVHRFKECVRVELVVYVHTSPSTSARSLVARRPVVMQFSCQLTGEEQPH